MHHACRLHDGAVQRLVAMGGAAMTRSARLRALREHAGHTQAAAAGAVHVAMRTWERWESGTRRCPDAVVHLYCLLTKQPFVMERRDSAPRAR